MLEVLGHEPALDVVAGEAERHLGEVVGAEGEELGHLGDLVGDERGARRLDHRADEVVELDARVRDRRTAATSRTHPSSSASSGSRDDERDHDLDQRVTTGALARDARPR